MALVVADLSKKDKRGIGHYGPQAVNLDQFNGLPGLSVPLWNPVAALGSPLWDSAVAADLALEQVQLQAAHNLALQVRSCNESREDFAN